MSVYNGERYLRLAIDSLRSQTLQDFELIVVDDASTDETPQILSEYSAQDARIRVLRNERNRRLPASLNRGLEACTSSLVARADADDVYDSRRLEKQVAYMGANPDVGVASCAVQQIDSSGDLLSVQHPPLTHDAIRFYMMVTCPINHPSVIFRRDVVLEARGYDPEYHRCEDYELWMRLLSRTTFANLPEPLTHYRIHDTSENHVRSSDERRVLVSLKQRMLSDYLERSVSESEAIALHSMLRRRFQRHPEDVLQAGVSILRELLERAKTKESSELISSFRADAADAIRRQALTQASTHRMLGLRLSSEMFRYDPGFFASPRGGKHLARLAGRMMFST